MIIHELYFDGLEGEGDVDAFLQAIRWDNAAALYERYSKQA